MQENREKQHLSKKNVCRGLCTVMSLSRYEQDERVPDKFLVDALLERLGLNPFRYEFVASDQEFFYSMRREQIEKLLYEEKNEAVWKVLEEYENQIQVKDRLHWQYLLLKKGILLGREKKYSDAIIRFREALEYTKSNKLEMEKQKDILLTNIETELFYLIGKFQYFEGNKKEAYVYFHMLKRYIDQRKLEQKKWKEHYPYILYILAQYELECHNLGKSYVYVKQAENILIEYYQFESLYDILKLKEKICCDLGIQEEINEQFLLTLRLISMSKNGKLAKKEFDLWESIASQQL